ncbi:MAG TPA: response regulator [Ktedonobacterales bacterium]|jgi:CheY-like chemotaxis protein|nr:response regulator [Ktedonobacterales bacterium]
MVQLLVIDRDDAIRETLVNLFEDAGYAVVAAASAAAALAFLRSHPDRVVVLFDAGVPGRESDGFFSAVAANGELARRHAYLCMTTNQEKLPPDLRAMLRSWAIPILSKPFDIESLLTAVAEAAQGLSVPRRG